MKKLATLAAAWALPVLAFAQTTAPVTNVYQAGAQIIGIINGVLVPLVFAIAFIVFIWGVFQYFIAGGHDEEASEKGRNLMLYGILGFFVMVAVWGLVNVLVGTFNLTNTPPQIPPTPGAH